MGYNHFMRTLVTILFVMAYGVAMAQVNGQMKLSYCKGEVASSSDIGSSGAATLEAASYIPSSMISDYRDLRVVGIKAGLSSRLNVESLTVWVRESLDGDNLCESSVSKSDGGDIKKGWNYLIPTHPYSAGKGTGFYIGYTVVMKGTGYPVSVVGQDHIGGLYVKTGNEWIDRCSDGKGTLSVEAIIEAENLPTFDLALTAVSIPGRIMGGDVATGRLAVSNEASMTISSFDVVYEIEGMAPHTINIRHELQPCTEDTVTFDFTPDLEGRRQSLPMSVSISNLEEGEDIAPDNNTLTTAFDLVKYDFTRMPLIEEFTTEPCSNCPRAAEMVHATLEDERYAGKVAAVCHHSGFQTDWLTSDADRAYVWLYGGSSYAPAMMFDRFAAEGNSPVTSVSSVEEIMKSIDSRMATQANVALSCTATYDAARNEIQIDVTGGHDWNMDVEAPRITVYLLENDVPALNQKGADPGYLQQHVVRGYNDIWGVTYHSDGDDDFSYTWSVGMDEEWVRDNMEVVAFVNSYDPDAYWNCRVENATMAKIDWGSLSVSEAMRPDRETVHTEWFTIDGTCLYRQPVAKGLYIRRDTHSDGTTTSAKILF